MKTWTHEEIFTCIQSCLAASLAIPNQKVRPTSRLIDDLGADSLDFLDILFSLEKKFVIKLRSAELDSLLRADFSDKSLVNKQFVPRVNIDRLIEWLPALKSSTDYDRITPYMLFSFITVESLIILVKRKLAEKNILISGSAT